MFIYTANTSNAIDVPAQSTDSKWLAWRSYTSRAFSSSASFPQRKSHVSTKEIPRLPLASQGDPWVSNRLPDVTCTGQSTLPWRKSLAVIRAWSVSVRSGVPCRCVFPRSVALHNVRFLNTETICAVLTVLMVSRDPITTWLPITDSIEYMRRQTWKTNNIAGLHFALDVSNWSP
jgi:hypothetical protein